MVSYTPSRDGPYTVCVKYGEQEVPRRSGLSHHPYRKFSRLYLL